MVIRLTRGKFVVDPLLDYAELFKFLPLMATLAQHDLGDKCKELTYVIVDGNLLACSKGEKEWWHYDYAVRTWCECNDPRKDT